MWHNGPKHTDCAKVKIRYSVWVGRHQDMDENASNVIDMTIAHRQTAACS